jgi:NAD+ synthase
VDPSVLSLDCAAEAERIAAAIRRTIVEEFRRRGAVVALSGGVDSAVCLALAVRALGGTRVLALLLPERESPPRGREIAQRLAEAHAVPCHVQDLTGALEAIGCYACRDEAIRALFPDYRSDWKSKLAIAGGLRGQFNYFKLVVQSPDGRTRECRLPHREYLQIVAAQNYKQRLRKTAEYFHADRLNYAVIGTPNRLEYDQGFFVKNGDGSADVKPIAHLYKTQVYALARHLGLPEEICAARPSTDTYSLPQTQEEFFFALPYEQMDLALWAHNHRIPAADLAGCLGSTLEQAEHVYRDIERKRATTRFLHARPRLVEAVPEIEAACGS